MMKNILLALIFMVTTFNAHSNQVFEDTTNKKHLKYVASLSFEVEPTYATNLHHYRIVPQMFEGLVGTNAEGVIVPEMASSWEKSSDGRVVTFYLRENANWSDGKPVIAQNFVDAYKQVLDPSIDRHKKPSYLFYDVVGVKKILDENASLDELGVYAIDDKTLELHLNRPLAYLSSLLLNPAYFPIPSHVINEHAEKWSSLENIVTNGAFVPVYIDENKMKLKKNEQYWGAHSVELEQIEMRDIDPVVGRGMLLSGQVDLVDISDIDLKEHVNLFKQFEGIQIFRKHDSSTFYLGINSLLPRFSNVKVRKALSYSLDRKKLAQVSGESNEVVYGFSANAKSIGWKRYTPKDFIRTDQEERERLAKSLLSEAGYTKENPLKLTLTHYTGLSTQYVARAIAHQWTKLGVKVDLRPITDFNKLYDHIESNDFEVAWMSWHADFDDPQNFFSVHGVDRSSSYKNWNNLEYISLFRSLELEMSSSKRVELATKLEEIIADEARIIPVYTSSMMTLGDDGIDFGIPNYLNTFGFKHIKIKNQQEP